ncbi:hypothetical protein [uncultured Thalassolituus sp.]|uniref:hypothetical protein n=1 Tax=uncultured Thalassolituus sp. TaxID=285273 RepID=UPI002607F66C|nr:hypothetical protein [uncultured Thalassolituus sp.]
MEVVASLRDFFRMLSDGLSGLLARFLIILPFIVLLEVGRYYFPGNHYGLAAVELIISSVFLLILVHYLLVASGIQSHLSFGRCITFIFAYTLVSLIASFGFLLFFIPGLLIMAASVLVPVLVLSERAGPIEAVGNSVVAFKGTYPKFFLLIMILWGSAFLGGIALGFVLTKLGVDDDVVETVSRSLEWIGCMFNAVICVSLYQKALMYRGVESLAQWYESQRSGG